MKLGEPDKSGRPRPIPIEGSEYTVSADTAIVAVGQSPSPPFKDNKYGIKTGKYGKINTDDKWRTTRKGVFAIGDVATGPADFANAIRSALQCANSVEKFFETGEWKE